MHCIDARTYNVSSHRDRTGVRSWVKHLRYGHLVSLLGVLVIQIAIEYC